MTPFPTPKGSTLGDLVHAFTQDQGDCVITLLDEGGGHFVKIKTTEHGVDLDPDELVAIAKWCAETCAELDAADAKS